MAKAKAVLVAAVILVLGACALPTTEKYQIFLNSWIGQPFDNLVLQWGPPRSSFKMGSGDTLAEFARSSTQVRGGEVFTQPVATRHGYRDVITHVTPAYAVTYYCNTRFLVAPDGIIKSYSLEGNNCVSY